MTDSIPEDIQAFLGQWTAAEQGGDTQRLEALLAGDFAGIGPLGFTLPGRPGWPATAQATSATTASASPRCRPASTVRRRSSPPATTPAAATRATLVLVHGTSGWRLAAIHLSFIAGTGGAPPIPGAARRPEAQPTQSQPSVRTR